MLRALEYVEVGRNVWMLCLSGNVKQTGRHKNLANGAVPQPALTSKAASRQDDDPQEVLCTSQDMETNLRAAMLACVHHMCMLAKIDGSMRADNRVWVLCVPVAR